MAERDQWKWQEPGTAWRGVGVYHVTLTVPSREPLLGTLVIPDGDPSKARIERTALGNAVVGTPHLDGQYTVFGEVEEGLDVVEMIQSSATGRGDRPLDDIEMRVTVID